VEESFTLITALSCHIGYEKATELAKKCASEGKTVRQVLQEDAILDEAALQRILNPLEMTKPGIPGKR
jgi:aspartate ammonia-lyase